MKDRHISRHKLSLRAISEAYLEQYGSKAKVSDINLFRKFLINRGKKSPTLSDFSYKNVKEFRNSLLKDGYAPSSVARYLATLKHFGGKVANYYGVENPAEEVKIPPIPEKEPDWLTKDEIAEVRAHINRFDSETLKLRTSAIFELMLATGLRASECVSLNIEQLELPYITRVLTKGGKLRNVYLNSSATEVLERWLKHRERLTGNCTGPVFVTFYASHFSRMPYDALKYAMQKLGIRSHQLRHTRGHTIARAAGPEVAREVLGHSSLNTTMKYIKASKGEVEEALENVEI